MKRIFQKWLFLFVLTAFVLTWGVSFFIQTRQAEYSAIETIRLRLADAKTEIARNANNLASIKQQNRMDAAAKARSFTEMIRCNPRAASSVEDLRRLAKVLQVDELNVIDGSGVITCSTVEKYIGYNMRSAEQSAEFMRIIENPEIEIVQEPRSIGFDSNIAMQYAGVARQDAPGVLQIAYKPIRLQRAVELADITDIALKFRIGRAGGIILIKGGKVLASASGGYVGKPLSKVDITESELTAYGTLFDAVLCDKEYLCIAEPYDAMSIIGYMSLDDVYAGRGSRMVTLTLCLLLIFLSVFMLVSRLVQNVVIRGIDDINASLARITSGDLDELVQVSTNKEFISLSYGINSMVGALKQAIAEAKGRIDAELQVAKAIQHSALPDAAHFPRNGSGFELSAEMFTAKEVGGDFYDFFFTDADHLVFVVADVSGKGIPAALFMMKCKTLINSIAETEGSPAVILSEANDRLCEGNEIEMFVTVWLGVLELSSGRLRYANAGHNFPLIARADGAFDYLENKPGLVLAGMDGIKYREFETRLERGDTIFLYTDGVTESIDGSENAYGEERLRETLNSCGDRSPARITECIREDLKSFTKGEPQFDDVTLMALRCTGGTAERLTLPVSAESAAAANAFPEEVLTRLGCPLDAVTKINIAVDEIFSNIVKYSGGREVTIECGAVGSDTAVVRFTDDGRPYDPLQMPEPDTSKPIDEREAGGLGIYLVKQMMDNLSYEYRDNKNILTVEKKFNTDIQ